MKCEKFFLMTVALTALTTVSADCPGCCEREVAAQSNQNYGGANNSGSSFDETMLPPGNCSAMTQDEQDFSAKLNDTNAMLFCSKMTSAQRQKAMQMAGTRGPSGVKMTPDDAVQNVSRNSGMPSGNKQRGGSACPVQ